MGRIFESLRDAGVVTLDVDLRRGTYEDFSVYRNAVSVAGTPTWMASKFGWGMQFPGGLAYLAPTRTAINQKPKTIIFLRNRSNRVASRILSCRDATNTDTEIFDDADLVKSFDGTTVRTVAYNTDAAVIALSAGFSVCPEGGTSFAAHTGGNGTINWRIGATSLSVAGGHYTGIHKVALLNVALSQTQAQDLLAELLSERFPTKAYSIMPAAVNGRRVMADININHEPTTLADITTANAEVFRGTSVRLVTGTAKITAQPKAIGCTGSAVVACPMPISATSEVSKRTSFVWTDSVVQCGFASVKGAATATGQNGYWWRCASGQLQITKSLAGVESTIGTDGTVTAGLEYDVQFNWSPATGSLRLWYRRSGTTDWTLASAVTDTDVTSSSYSCMYMVGSSNKIVERVTFLDQDLEPALWG